MKSFIAALAAATAIAAVAAPAAAQTYGGGYGYGYGYDYDQGGRWDNREAGVANHLGRRLALIQDRIDRNLRRGVLTWNEASRLQQEARSIAWMQDRYERGGLNLRERAVIDQRLDRLAWNVRRESRDGDRSYGYGYGYDRRY